jgi:hypothetical protein
MDSAVSAASPGSEKDVPDVRRRRTKPPVARRAGFQLLAGVLIVGAIPVFSTVRILEGNALRNERAHADSALRAEVENGLRQLGTLGNDASTRAADLARSPVVQRAFIAKRRDALARLARENPGVAFYLGQTRISGPAPTTATVQPVWLTVNGVRVGKVVVAVPLGAGLAARLTRMEANGAWRQWASYHLAHEAAYAVLSDNKSRLGAVDGGRWTVGGEETRGLGIREDAAASIPNP